MINAQFILTEKAAKQVALLLEKEQNKDAQIKLLRIGIRGGGCSGLSYFMEFTAAQEPKDVLFKQHGVDFIIDPKSMLYLQGTELDYLTSIRESGFQFRNPKQKKSCGCGESFSV